MEYFDGELYFDDRMFVFYLCKGDVKIDKTNGVVVTNIYHENPPDDFVWCLVTYRNCEKYPSNRVDCFHNERDAIKYLQNIEPSTPLINLNGNSPRIPKPYEEYIEWKKENNLKEYDYKAMYLDGGSNPTEQYFQRIETFQGIR